jgi:hypothetical protein
MTKDHTIHAKCEGVVRFTREMSQRGKVQKFITTVHVVPALGLNRKERYPRSFVYHPEQFPELEEFNPEPSEWKVSRRAQISLEKKKLDQVDYKYRHLYQNFKDFDMESYLESSKY